jgi:hypothetical protein
VRLDGRGESLDLRHACSRDELVGRARELDPAAKVRLAIGWDRLEQRLDTPAMRVAADHDVVDAEVVDAVFQLVLRVAEFPSGPVTVAE